jgi:phosphoglycolate phosphatase
VIHPLVIFDLDGTLVDTPQAIVEAFQFTFEAMSRPIPDPDQIRATIGFPLEKALSSLLQVSENHDSVAQGLRQYKNAFTQVVLPRSKHLVFPGVERELARMRHKNFRLSVATSKFHASAELLLRSAGLRDYFDMVLGADQVKRPKPDPESGRVIMQALQAHPDQTIMVGDTTHDLLMARAAGIRSIAVTYGVHGLAELNLGFPTWIAHNFGEVAGYLHASFGGGK